MCVDIQSYVFMSEINVNKMSGNIFVNTAAVETLLVDECLFVINVSK